MQGGMAGVERRERSSGNTERDSGEGLHGMVGVGKKSNGRGDTYWGRSSGAIGRTGSIWHMELV